MPRRLLTLFVLAFIAGLAISLVVRGGSATASDARWPSARDTAELQLGPLEPIVVNEIFTLRETPLEPGTQAIVRADGSCLRMREAPGLGAAIVTCLPEGSIVTVMPSAEELEEYRWQLVMQGDRIGWVADEFLEPFAGPPACSGSASQKQRPGLNGSLPSSGVGAVLWGGGTTSGVFTEAVAQGCRPRSVWTTQTGTGRMIGYLTRVPDFVNQDWTRQFPDGRIPADTILLVLCGGEDEATSPLLSARSEPPQRVSPLTAPGVEAAAVVMMDEASGAILFERDARQPLPPASLTKIATAILAIEGADLNQWVLSDVDSRTMYGSSRMGLQPGDCLQLRDLLYGLMLPSGNDAALAIARYVSGSDAAFVEMMNLFVRERLGLTESSFTDPHGLGGRGHSTSAYDLAVLSRYAMTLPEFAEVVRAPSWVARGSRTFTLTNVNRFLSSYPGADGLKTGFTEAAGRTLIASAMKDGHRVFVVLLDAPDRFADAEKLLDWAFSAYRWTS